MLFLAAVALLMPAVVDLESFGSLKAHPAVIDLMQNEEKQAVDEAARRFQRRITLNPRPEYHIEQFDLHGK